MDSRRLCYPKDMSVLLFPTALALMMVSFFEKFTNNGSFPEIQFLPDFVIMYELKQEHFLIRPSSPRSHTIEKC